MRIALELEILNCEFFDSKASLFLNFATSLGLNLGHVFSRFVCFLTASLSYNLKL